MVGGAIEAGRAIYEGEINRAVALGNGYHHAGRNYGGGFCLFNDIAMLVEYLRKKLKRILILDYDVHFGNGTSDIYFSDPHILFISLHQDPRTIYPGTGFIEQIGRGEGEGYNVNVLIVSPLMLNMLNLTKLFVRLMDEKLHENWNIIQQ